MDQEENVNEFENSTFVCFGCKKVISPMKSKAWYIIWWTNQYNEEGAKISSNGFKPLTSQYNEPEYNMYVYNNGVV